MSLQDASDALKKSMDAINAKIKAFEAKLVGAEMKLEFDADIEKRRLRFAKTQNGDFRLWMRTWAGNPEEWKCVDSLKIPEKIEIIKLFDEFERLYIEYMVKVAASAEEVAK